MGETVGGMGMRIRWVVTVGVLLPTPSNSEASGNLASSFGISAAKQVLPLVSAGIGFVGGLD